MIIIDTPEEDLSNVDRKYDKRKVRTYLLKSSLIIFSCSVRAIYNIFNCDKKKRLVLKSYIPGIDSLIGPKRHYCIFVSEI